MIVFWLLSAAMLVIAVLLLMPALLGRRRLKDIDRDQQNVAIARQRLRELESAQAEGTVAADELAQARLDIEDALLTDLDDEAAPARTAAGTTSGYWAVAVALALPVAASGLYLKLGEPHAIAPTTTTADVAAQQDGESGGDAQSIEAAVTVLEQRLQSAPDDPEGWFVLARSYMFLKRYDEAVSAFENLHRLVGDDPGMLVRYADAAAMAGGGRIAGRPFELVQRALAVDPNQPQGLWLAGMGAAEQGDHASALGYWRRLEPLLENDAASLAEIRELMARSEQQLAETGGTGDDAAVAAAPVIAAAAAAKSLTVSVALDDKLAARVSPSDTVFVFARAVNGPPMPLAVVRRRAGELPLQVTLDDSMAMVPAMRLSQFEQVRVGARISRSGQAQAQSGDLQGEIASVTLADTATVKVTITDVVP